MAEEKKIKLHARVTREIEITLEQAERLVNYLCDSSENNEIDDILEMFTDGIENGGYDYGYIPDSWLESDLNDLPDGELKTYLKENANVYNDIDL